MRAEKQNNELGGLISFLTSFLEILVPFLGEVLDD